MVSATNTNVRSHSLKIEFYGGTIMQLLILVTTKDWQEAKLGKSYQVALK